MAHSLFDVFIKDIILFFMQLGNSFFTKIQKKRKNPDCYPGFSFFGEEKIK